MKAAEIRTKFLEYFKRNGHTVVESSSLVPQNDPTLLFTNAGMNQFKDCFLGKEKRAYVRATTSQKCVRAGGKHNDLENVGFTARHHTFFEMLGNFSFGDYFKPDAIRFAWEFITKELKIPKEKLYVSVFEQDDEAAELWHQQEGVPKDRIYRLGEKDNFWAMGDTGPCGPCTEIYVDRGEKYGCGKPTCKLGCDCDRYMEIWNLVFMQFNRDASGTLNPLPKPAVDTGAGLERIASVIQEVDSNYDTDLFRDIMDKTGKLAGQPYSPKAENAASFRVIADHSRATAFLIGDGVMPSNEGRGYVLRRIMRRAIRHGKKLGLNAPFLHKTAGYVIDQMRDAYPDLEGKRKFIEKAVLAEEEQFFKTLERGLALLDEETSKLGGKKTLSGDVVFKLYDTYGFPLDLTRVICAEREIGVDEAGFEAAMAKQRAESRKNWKGLGDAAIEADYFKLADELRAKKSMPQFVGYEKGRATSKCVGLFIRTEKEFQRADLFTMPAPNSGGEAPLVEAVFAETPFYGESGGQVGDQGYITGEGFEGEVIDVQRPGGDLIVAKINPKKGALKVGGTYTQEVHAELRALTARNHTATHLLHWALRKLLGEHVKQAGSIVTPELLRFDFSHFQALTADELLKLEDMINEKIWAAQAVQKREMKKDAAVAAGAIAFFGEKYGDLVRVVSVGDFSTELCGGTHVDNSGDIHLFKIGSESGIAAGVRRIVAYTSKGAFNYLRARDEEIKGLRDRLKASSTDEIMGKVDKLFASEKELRRKIEQLQAQSAGDEAKNLIQSATSGAGFRFVSGICVPDAAGMKKMRDLTDSIKQQAPDSVTVIGMKDPDGGKAYVMAAVGPKASGVAKANEIIQKIAPLIEGRGGGKPELAQAGGTKLDGLEAALKAARDLVLK
ncbi:MAG: alanine--tRNA ligase [Bacteriovoracia bacterium]